MAQDSAPASSEQAYLRDSVAAFDAPATASTPQSSLYEMAVAAVQRHPVLAVAAVATVSAITIMALKPSQSPRSKLQALERDAAHQLRDTEKYLRRALDRSGIPSSVETLTGTLAAKLATLDASQLEPLWQRVTQSFNNALARLEKR